MNKSSATSTSPINKDKVTVIVRCRPLSSKEVKQGHKSCIATDREAKTLSISKLGKENAVLSSSKGMIHKYSFNDIFGESHKQSNIYNGQISESVKSCCLNGVNSTIFAYGATGSGKTYTMMGKISNKLDHGIIPRTVKDIFINCTNHVINMSYLEVYNEKLQDLLSESKRSKRLIPCEDPYDKSIKILGLTEHIVTNLEEVLDFLEKGSSIRKTNSTAANEHSSRSHAILIFKIYSRKTRLTSKLSLIDLAGSERANRTQTSGKALREGANINKSLLALSNCISALSKSSTTSVKYRDSKLTHILKSSFTGNCKVIMLACIHPSYIVYDETQNTLKYAGRANKIEISFEEPKETVEMPKIGRIQNDMQNKFDSMFPVGMKRERKAKIESSQPISLPKIPPTIEHGSATITVEVLADIAAKALLQLSKDEGSTIVSESEKYTLKLTQSKTKAEKVKLKVRRVLEHAMKRNIRKSRSAKVVKVPPQLKDTVEVNTLKAEIVAPTVEENKENEEFAIVRKYDNKKKNKWNDRQSITAKELNVLLKKRIDTPHKPKVNKQARIEELMKNFERETRNDDFSKEVKTLKGTNKTKYNSVKELTLDKVKIPGEVNPATRKRKKFLPGSARLTPRRIKSRTIGFLSRK